MRPIHSHTGRDWSVFTPSLACVLLSALPVAISPVAGFAADGATPGRASFVNDVMPVLTKAGCNSGSCHAKAGIGQNGFRLSVLGFEPAEDYEHIVKEARGRRISVAAPSPYTRRTTPPGWRSIRTGRSTCNRWPAGPRS